MKYVIITFLSLFLINETYSQTVSPITIYQDINYNGISLELDQGTITYDHLSPVGNDQISSIRISEGWKVTLFKDGLGSEQLVLINSTRNLIDYNFNDVVSTVVIEKIKDETHSYCDLDKSKMIPIRDHPTSYDFEMRLAGNALKTPLDIHFDTGSWLTAVPYDAINQEKITVLQESTTECWGMLTDKVQGQLCVTSVDGTEYCIDDYIFYAIRSENAAGPGAIIGGFPSLREIELHPSLPYALTQKYSSNNMGIGIISDCNNGDIELEWASQKCYLQLGLDPTITENLHWRSDIPFHRKAEVMFSPEFVPGFNIIIQTPNNEQPIMISGLSATVDTGAPHLTLKTGKNDPHLYASFRNHFVENGVWEHWGSCETNRYCGAATTLIDAKVTVEFIDDNGNVSSYNFPVGKDLNPSARNTLIATTWESQAPWAINQPSFPETRINLGNTIYFYCPVYFWDIENKRVGIAFR